MDAVPISLESVLANEELSRRQSRPPDHAGESQALDRLAHELAASPRRVLQALSDVALTLCRAHSAGISLLEEEGGRRIFRWHAVSGQWASYLWNTLPRDFSPCGTVLDRQVTQLMVLPERYFTPLLQVSPKVFEVLLIPFSVGGHIAGTVWVIAHDESRQFDSEDHRIVSNLAKFASVAYERLSSLSAEDVLHLARLNKNGSLPRQTPVKSIQRKVLVVDDNIDAAASLALILRGMGHQVEVAHDGRSGVAISRTMRPDIVLLDIAMPGMDGYQAAREIRQVLGAAVRIFALTGYGQDEDRLQSADAGIDQHLVKPLDPAFLKSLLRS